MECKIVQIQILFYIYIIFLLQYRKTQWILFFLERSFSSFTVKSNIDRRSVKFALELSGLLGGFHLISLQTSDCEMYLIIPYQ